MPLSAISVCPRSGEPSFQSISVIDSAGLRCGAGSRWHSKHQAMLSVFT